MDRSTGPWPAAGGAVIAFGNGGSAAEAQHLTAELVGRFLSERQPLSAICLSAETSSLTAILNDYGPEEVFARQLHWVRAVTLHPDQRVSQLVQYAREIVIEPRTQQELFEADPPFSVAGPETNVMTTGNELEAVAFTE